MDLENYSNVNELAKYKNIEPPYPQSNESHLSTNNEDRITDVEILHKRYTNIIKENEKNDLFDNPIRTSHHGTLNGQNNDRGKSQYNRDFLINQSYSEVNATSFGACHGSDCSCSQKTFYMTSRQFERLNRSSSKTAFRIPSNGQKIKYKNYENKNKETEKVVNNYTFIKPVDDENISGDKQENFEKVTYSRPQIQYDDEFIHKTMKLNIKLQKIMRKLLIECRRKKQEETWNNYIKNLKIKHGYFKDEELEIAQHNSPEYHCNTWQQFDPVPNLLHDIYRCHKNIQANSEINYVPQLDPERAYYKNNQYCYPTSSQALIKMKKEKCSCSDERCCKNKRYHNDTNRVELDVHRAVKPHFPPNTDKIFNDESNCVNVTMGTQTDVNLQNFRNCACKEEYINAKVKQASRGVVDTSRESKTIEIIDPGIRHLDNIQQKLDNLINSVNSVILAVRALVEQRKLVEQASRKTSIQILNDKNNIHETEKDYITMTLQNINRPLPMSEISTSISQFREFTMSKMHEVIHEEMEKSTRIKRDIQELLHTRCNNQCATQLSFDIPTKDSKECQKNRDKLEVKNNLIKSEDDGEERKQMTIAVNTDPLGLLALLRVSTDTIKRVLSYMLNLNYQSYISMLQLPRPCTENYICYICGDSFSRPTELGEHIRQHNLGRLRDSCLCRHVVGMKPDGIGVFKCKYCGQCFSRSYCCELHQQTCAQIFGLKHDVLPDLMILR